MKKNKPKGRTPSLIGGTLGTPHKTIVQRLSACNRCREPLANGTECYEIPQLGKGFSNKKKYCMDCFSSIIVQSKKDLEKFSMADSPSP